MIDLYEAQVWNGVNYTVLIEFVDWIALSRTLLMLKVTIHLIALLYHCVVRNAVW